MGCTPSAHQGQRSTSDIAGSETNYDQNKNSSQVLENNAYEKSGCGWRKKTQHSDKIKEVMPSVKDSSNAHKENWENAHPNEIGSGNRGTVRVLLLFQKEDSVYETFSNACLKLNFELFHANSIDGAEDVFSQRGYDIVVIDGRSTKHWEAQHLCKSLKQSKWNKKSLFIAVIKKSFLEDSSCKSLLAAGFYRCISETTNISICTNELLQLDHNELKTRTSTSIANSQALQVALSRCRDLIQITDDSFHIQYLNKASEHYLGFRSEDVKGKLLTDLHHGPDCLNAISHQLVRGKEWEGSVTCRRKSGDPITLTCRVAATIGNGRTITHYIFIQDCPDSSTILKDHLPRGSFHSIRKGSYDVKSLASESGQSIRRQSLAKLNSLPIEAPITKIITLICSAQEQSTPAVQQQLDKVVDILRSTELYSPQLKENRIRPDDPITTDLISALLQQGTVPVSTTRRSSNDSANVRGSSGSRPSLPSINTPGQLTSILEQSLDWEFDIFRLEELSNQRPLVWLGMNLMCHFSVHDTLGVDEKTLMNWLTVVEMNYHSSNSYHNSTHAADVMQAAACYMKRDRLKQIFDPLDEACTLIAACCHDIDHPGKSSAFLCNSDDELAILYNDQCVLESHHSALTFKLSLSDERVNIFKELERDTYKVARQNIIDMILATEMTKHYEHLAKFVNVFTKPEYKDDDSPQDIDLLDISMMTSRENVVLVKRMLIKCADVSNPTRPLKQCVIWAKRIAEEYFNQTDEEKANNIPVVMPMFDRATCSIPKSQIGFVDFIINDMMEAWDSYIDFSQMLYYLRTNYQYWKEKEEQGVTSIDELDDMNRQMGLLSEMDEKSE